MHATQRRMPRLARLPAQTPGIPRLLPLLLTANKLDSPPALPLSITSSLYTTWGRRTWRPASTLGWEKGELGFCEAPKRGILQTKAEKGTDAHDQPVCYSAASFLHLRPTPGEAEQTKAKHTPAGSTGAAPRAPGAASSEPEQISLILSKQNYSSFNYGTVSSS